MSQFFRAFLAVLTGDLSADLGATTSQLSLASGAWFLTFALAQFPIGIWLDRFGPRRMTSALFVVGAAGGSLAMSFATSPTGLIVAMSLIGLGCSPVLMASFFIFAKSFSPKQFGLLSAWLIAFGTFGNLAGAKPLALLAEAHGWRSVMFGLFVVSMLIGLAILLFVRDPELDKTSGEGHQDGSFLSLMRLKNLWPIIPIITIAYSVPAGLRGLWAAPYLSEMFNADAIQVGTATLWMAFAMIAGSLFYGPMDRWLSNRKLLILAGNILVVGSMLVLAIKPNIGWSSAVLMLAVCGFAGMSYPILMAHARTFFPSHLVGRGVTLMNFFSIGGVGMMQWVTAGLVSDSLIQKAPVSAFQILFGIYVLALGSAIVLYLAAKELPDNKGTNE